MSYFGEASYCSIEFRNEVLEICFPSERIVSPRYLTLVVVFFLSTNSEVHVFGYNNLFMLKYYYLSFTSV